MYQMMVNEVDKKAKYHDAGGISFLDIAEAKLTPEQFEGFLLGNILKYSTRANFKGCKLRDVEKVEIYGTALKLHLRKMRDSDLVEEK